MRVYLLLTALLLLTGTSIVHARDVGSVAAGAAAELRNAPYIVSIGMNGHQCTGVIIASQWVLTTAQCASGLSEKLLRIRYSSTYHGFNGQLAQAAQIILHPRYNADKLEADIALIRTHDLKYTSFYPRLAEKDLKPGVELTLYGWGTQVEESGLLSPFLKETSLTTQYYYDCQIPLIPKGLTLNSYAQICAGDLYFGGKGPCQGDIGAPLFADRLYGLVSYSLGCGRPGFPAIFTAVNAFGGWINETQSLYANLTEDASAADATLALKPLNINQNINSELAKEQVEEDQVQLLDDTPVIKGASNLAFRRAPFVVSIGVNGHYCSGVIVKANWILTAASCVFGQSKKLLRIRYNSGHHGFGGKTVRVEQIEIWSSFNSSTLSGNVALLKTSTPLSGYTEHSHYPNLASKYPAKGQALSFFGWSGATEESGRLSHTLKETVLRQVDYQECSETYGEAGFTIGDWNLCAGDTYYGGRGICLGDIGAPLIEAESSTIYGLASYTLGCGRPGYPAVFTRIGYLPLKAWFDKMLKSE